MSTINDLIIALVERDTRQFPTTFTTEERVRYAERYVLDMLQDILNHNPTLDEVFKMRTQIVQSDVETAKNWEPK